MGNLMSFTLRHAQLGEISISHFLDFFKSAPRLQDIRLQFATPTSGGQDGRLISLGCLEWMDCSSSSHA